MALTALLAAEGLSKAFGPVKACDAVYLSVAPGEIVALLGENGAGKSTLVKMLFGALQPDAGRIVWQGTPVRLTAPSAARQFGIAMVHQHFSLFEALTVAQNLSLVLDRQPLRQIARDARKVSAAYGLSVNTDALVADLSAGERQRVEIVRCLLEDPRLLIMDEPTSVLTPQEVERLFEILNTLRDEGRSILFISHKLDEVRTLCDRAVILRQGKVVANVDPSRETAASLATAMVGETVRSAAVPGPARRRDVALDVSNLFVPPATALSVALNVPRLTVCQGEVLGIAGIAGNGQAELFGTLSGETTAASGTIMMHGTDATSLGIDARRALGAAFVPEERIGHAADPTLSLADNVILSRHLPADGTTGPLGLLSRPVSRRMAERIIATMDVRAQGTGARAASLSGGNLQKFVVGRELERRPSLLVVNQPTWGVDAGAAVRIHSALSALSADGAAIVLVSQDLDELFALSHTVAVLCDGTLSAPEPAASMTRERVGLMMAGADPRLNEQRLAS